MRRGLTKTSITGKANRGFPVTSFGCSVYFLMPSDVTTIQTTQFLIILFSFVSHLAVDF